MATLQQDNNFIYEGWFPRLVAHSGEEGKALLEHYHEDQLQGSLVVSRETNVGGRCYRRLHSHIALMDLITMTPGDQRCYHEVIMPSVPQKPRFDLDIPEESLPSGVELKEYGERVKDHVITVVIQILSEMGVEVVVGRDISIFSSHRQDKRSYHIILHRYCHSSNLEAMALYQMVIERTEPWYHRLIDRGIYNRYCSLRLLWCHKMGEPLRPKRWMINYRYRGSKYQTVLPIPARDERHLNIMALGFSLITFTSGCSFLPPLAVERPVSYKEHEFHPLEMEQLASIIEGFDPMLELSGTKGSLLQLRRKGPSHCSICNRIHNAENPYGWVVGSEVYYNCRRSSEGAKLHIGTIDIVEPEPEVQEQKEDSSVSTIIPPPVPLLHQIPRLETEADICGTEPSIPTVLEMNRDQMKRHKRSTLDMINRIMEEAAIPAEPPSVQQSQNGTEGRPKTERPRGPPRAGQPKRRVVGNKKDPGT